MVLGMVVLVWLSWSYVVSGTLLTLASVALNTRTIGSHF